MSYFSTISYFILLIILGIVIGYYLKNFFEKTPVEKTEIIKKWLLYAVAVAERQLGPGTGKLKLAQVYNKFVTECPNLAKYISYENFSKLVDEVLEEFKDILNSNANIKTLIEGEDENG